MIFSTLASDMPCKSAWMRPRHGLTSPAYTLIFSICLRVVMLTPDTVLMAAALTMSVIIGVADLTTAHLQLQDVLHVNALECPMRSKLGCQTKGRTCCCSSSTVSKNGLCGEQGEYMRMSFSLRKESPRPCHPPEDLKVAKEPERFERERDEP